MGVGSRVSSIPSVSQMQNSWLHPPSPSKFTPFCFGGSVQYMSLSADPRTVSWDTAQINFPPTRQCSLHCTCRTGQASGIQYTKKSVASTRKPTKFRLTSLEFHHGSIREATTLFTIPLTNGLTFRKVWLHSSTRSNQDTPWSPRSCARHTTRCAHLSSMLPGKITYHSHWARLARSSSASTNGLLMLECFVMLRNTNSNLWNCKYALSWTKI